METGWREDAFDDDWGGGVPDEFTEEDYRRAIGDLPGQDKPPPTSRQLYLLAVGLVLVFALVWTLVL